MGTATQPFNSNVMHNLMTFICLSIKTMVSIVAAIGGFYIFFIMSQSTGLSHSKPWVILELVGRISLRNPPHENLPFGAIRFAIGALQNQKTMPPQANIHAAYRGIIISRQIKTRNLRVFNYN